MFDNALRGWKDSIADPVTQMMPKSITPGHITLCAFVCGMVSCLLATIPDQKGLTLTFWALNRLLDCLDGSLARSRNVATELGGFLDLLGDFIVYSCLPIAIALGQPNSADPFLSFPAVAVLEASFHINNFVLFYIAAVAAKRSDSELTSITMTPALVEGFEAGLFFTLMIVWPSIIWELSYAMSLAVMMSIVQRVLTLVPILESLDKRGEESHRSK